MPRKNKTYYSQSNRERLKWLWEQDMIHPDIRGDVEKIVQEKFNFSDDVLQRIKNDKVAWKNYQQFSDSYKRLRIGYIQSVIDYPEEFEKRLAHFIRKTRENKLIPGYGGIDKYY
ncbi:MAG: YdeI/OmpD-associated family protein [Puniceicoccales bacterium]|nr:YdeI/OmpD-associated family protein [Puniceicoccales bacterium]